MNDNILGTVFVMGALFSGFLGSGVGFALGFALPYEGDLGYPLLMGFLGFVVALSMALQLFEVLDSTVAAVFVCFAEQPSSLKITKPELYHAFASTYSQCDFCRHL